MAPDDDYRQQKKWKLVRRYLESPSAGYLAQQLIERHEGFSQLPRTRADGQTVIGYGTNLHVRGLSEMEAGILLARDITTIEMALSRFPWWSPLAPAQQAAIIDMAYCIGISAFLGFRQTISHLEAGNFLAAGDAMLTSATWKAFGERAKEDAMIVALGVPIKQEENA